MDAARVKAFSEALGFSLQDLVLLQENKYCLIYRGEGERGRCIVKHYRGEDTTLLLEEASALATYHGWVEDDPKMLDSGEPLVAPEENLLCIGFVEGEAFSDLLYRARWTPGLRGRALEAMKILGGFLRKTYVRTVHDTEEPAPFLFEYFAYCSRNLASLPLLGPLFFQGLPADAESLGLRFREARVPPSFAHGDLVFKNIHVSETRVGLIDFANANPRSHLLNDLYNLRFALHNMLLKPSFKEALLLSLYEGLGPLRFPEIVHAFYHEYHRRRWLMLKLKGRSPKDRLQALRGLLTFARPFSPEAALP